jgi:hypothetical protein
MAHYAFLNENYIVTEVIVGRDESNFDWESHYGDIRGQLCKRTSYNTVGGIHKSGGQPFRKNYAGIGFIYDSVRDAFYSQQPYPSWILNEQTCLWESPVPYPNDNKIYTWNEEQISWQLLPDQN